MTSLSSFRGLTSADIASLFGTSSSSDATTKDSDTTSPAATKAAAGPASGTQITGAGSNAAKAIQSIVTKLQVEKMQTDVQGKISTLSLASASVAATFTTEVASPADGHAISISMAAIDSVATATANDTAGAIDALSGQIQTQEAQIEARQGGVLTNSDEEILGRGTFSTLLSWTTNSATMETQGVSNEGVVAESEAGMLGNALQSAASETQQFQGPPSTSSDDAGVPSSKPSNSGGVLYLTLSAVKNGLGNGDYSVLEAQEQKLVSAFQNGTLPGQNGKTPEDGMGFEWYAESGDDIYSISGTWMANYDSSTVTAKNVKATEELGSFVNLYATGPTHYSEIAQSVAMGGSVVGVDITQNDFRLSSIDVVIPLKSS